MNQKVIVLTCNVKGYPDERMWRGTYALSRLEEAKRAARKQQDDDPSRKYFLNYMSLERAELLEEKYLDYVSDIDYGWN